MEAKTKVTVEASVKRPIEKVWKLWNEPAHVIQWNNASPDWHTPKAENDLREGGKFCYTMAAKDGSMSFDFTGVYNEVLTNRKIAYTMGDSRKAEVNFASSGNEVKIITVFEAENENPVDMQKMGWQSILDSFKKYAESN